MSKKDEELGVVFAYGKYDEEGRFAFHYPLTCIPLQKFKELLFKDFKEWLDEQA